MGELFWDIFAIIRKFVLVYTVGLIWNFDFFSQDAPEMNLNELRKMYSNYNPYVSNQLDDYGLDRLQLQLLAQYAQNK